MCDWKKNFTGFNSDFNYQVEDPAFSQSLLSPPIVEPNPLDCTHQILDAGDGEFIVRGHVNSSSLNPVVQFWAANPPTYSQSYTGSGLPFPNPEVAYENTPNRGAVKAYGGNFEFRIRYPNGYYIGLGTIYQQPCVHIKVCDGTPRDFQKIVLGNGIPFRSLTYPPQFLGTRARSSPLFYGYKEDLPFRTQEQILRDSAYPNTNTIPKNFWGLKPPC
jgi:hypothetical protein